MINIQAKPVSFSEAVLLRPMMYTLNGSFAEVIAFLEGYHSGAAKGNPYAPLVMEWEAFRGWLAAQFCVDTAEVFIAFQTRYGAEQTALEELAARLARFQEGKSS